MNKTVCVTTSDFCFIAENLRIFDFCLFCIDEHKRSVIGKHMREDHKEDASRIEGCFSILRKCQGKYECLLYEMLYIKELSPSLNTQSDSIRSKLYT